MRTTVRLDDHLMRQVKNFAVRQGKTLTSVMEESLRQLLATRGKKKIAITNLVTVTGGTIAPGVDLDDTASLLDIMEQKDDPH